MDYLPIFMDLKGRRCLVVGGGKVAARKASMLVRAGATLRVVAPRLASIMQALEQTETDVEFIHAPFNPQHLDGCLLVVAATDQQAVNQRVHEMAVARGIPVNVVDQPALCSFIFPAIVDRSPITIAVSSGGKAPVLTRMLRNQLESTLPAGYGRVAQLASRFRDEVRTRIKNMGSRRLFWEQALEGPAAEAAMQGDHELAEYLFRQELESGQTHYAGEVFLIGAGPGDPDLMTFRALRLLQKADVVVYDRLVPESIVDLARREAERIYVGKRRSEHTLPQEEISQLLMKLALQGKKVARLKGGDPFVFGRGGEEIEVLAEANVPFQVVPGITAASGCAAYAGIPLTHRDHAQSVRFVTGHTRNGQLDLDWGKLITRRETLVFYMGLSNLDIICRELREHGLDGRTPAALIEKGTTPEQRVHTGNLDTLPGLAAAASAGSPGLLIVGEVASLHVRLGASRQDPRARSIEPREPVCA